MWEKITSIKGYGKMGRLNKRIWVEDVCEFVNAKAHTDQSYEVSTCPEKLMKSSGG